VQDLLNVFKALSEETRLRILKLLENGELCVCDIVAAVGMSQPKVSFHLNALKEAGFLKDRKQGRWIHYRLDETDFFRRSLLLSVFERIPEKAVAGDRARLDGFLLGKNSKENPVRDKKRCCGEKK
jgi:ArsR family transcriptional regulator, arsenate/arsenite/antimonite-responsive transcriptional repressor